jgi:hypothetical protein
MHVNRKPNCKTNSCLALHENVRMVSPPLYLHLIPTHSSWMIVFLYFVSQIESNLLNRYYLPHL